MKECVNIALKKDSIDLVLKRAEAEFFTCYKKIGPQVKLYRACQCASEPGYSEVYEIFEVQDGPYVLADGEVFNVLKS